MNLNLKENYTTPAAVVECDLRKEIMLLKMQLAAAQREIRLAGEALDKSPMKVPPGKLLDRMDAWVNAYIMQVQEFKAEQKAVIDEWKAKR